MTKRPFLLALLLGSTLPAYGQVHTVVWEAPTTNEDGSPLTDLAGYKIQRWDNTSAQFESASTIVPTSCDLPTPPTGRSYYTVKALDTSGNISQPSNTIEVDVCLDTTTLQNEVNTLKGTLADTQLQLTQAQDQLTSINAQLTQTQSDLLAMTKDRDFWHGEVITAKFSRNLAQKQLNTCLTQKVACGCK